MANRYSRQILYPGIGEAGQQRIQNSRVVVIGCGALGTVSSEMLCRAGIGNVSLIDRDFVEESNLQRQTLFTEEDARQYMPKAVAAERALRAVNSEIEVKGIVEDVTFRNIEEFCRNSQIIIDGTDNFETRYLLNDYSIKQGVPWIYGACLGSYGIAFAFRPQATACLQCLFEQPPETGSVETCDTAGILAPVVHAVAAYQVAQTMKLLVGGDPAGEMLRVDVWENEWRLVPVSKARNEACPCCGSREFRFLEGKERDRLTRLCGRDAVQVYPGRPTRLDFEEISRRLKKSGKVDFNEYMMRIRINGYEIALFPDGRSIIKGTDDFSEARAIYAKYIGN